MILIHFPSPSITISFISWHSHWAVASMRNGSKKKWLNYSYKQFLPEELHDLFEQGCNYLSISVGVFFFVVVSSHWGSYSWSEKPTFQKGLSYYLKTEAYLSLPLVNPNIYTWIYLRVAFNRAKVKFCLYFKVLSLFGYRKFEVFLFCNRFWT